VRARPLLQLHKLVADGRPKPAFELLPSAIFSPKLTRAIARVFGARHRLCPTDLALVRAEQYHRHEEENTDDDESRDVLALICGAGRKDSTSSAAKVRIFFADGSEWEACQLPNGGYECCSTDVHGLKRTVRWVQKKNVSKSTETTSDADASSSERKFNFSTITSNTRRHPIIASLASTSLDIADMYTVPTPATSSLVPTQCPDETAHTAEFLNTTEELRNIITVTAAFVAVREGWCPSYRTDDALTRSPSVKSISSSKCYATPPGSPRKHAEAESGVPVQRSGSIRNIIRTPSLLRRHPQAERPTSSHSFTSTSPLGTVTSTSALNLDAASAPAFRRARADTTSTVIFNGEGEQWRPEFATAEEEDDDEDKDAEEETDDEEVEDTGRNVGAAMCDGVDKKEPPSTSASPNGRGVRMISEGSSSGSEMWKEKSAAQAGTVRQERKEKRNRKNRVLRILACGMF